MLVKGRGKDYSTYLSQICAVIALRAMSTSGACSREYPSNQYNDNDILFSTSHLITHKLLSHFPLGNSLHFGPAVTTTASFLVKTEIFTGNSHE